MSNLPPAVSGERIDFESRAGRIGVIVDGPAKSSAPPLLLVHSINAAGCAAEVRPVHDRYRGDRTVITPDLPGFGLSERAARNYTPRMMTDAIADTIAELRRRGRIGEGPVDALALSLSSEFLARAASESPSTFRTLALVSPTGFNGSRDRHKPAGSTRYMPVFDAILRGPGWGGFLFRQLTRPSVIRYFLERTWGAKNIDEELWRYDVLTTRAPGAEFAPLSFLSGGLFSDDIHTIYESLSQPVWACHGVRGDFVDYRELSLVRGRANWTITEMPTGALPFFEIPDTFFAEYDRFLASSPAA